MDAFIPLRGCLHAEQVSLEQVAARFSTPCYVYSRAALEAGWRSFDQALQGRAHLVCFAVKANSNLAVLQLLASLGSGFDIVSAGELQRVLRAGARADRIVFSGVGKNTQELRLALETGIKCCNVESEPELMRLNGIAGELGLTAPVALRINPDVDPDTHPHVATGRHGSKFGLPWPQALKLFQRAADLPYLQPVGIACHIGSQITSLTPFLQAARKLSEWLQVLERVGIQLRHLNLGGGLGVPYAGEPVPSAAQYTEAVCSELGALPLELVLEPGRAIAAGAGVLLTRVEYLKRGAGNNFAVVDAAMNDLLRPALYDARHEIVPVRQHKQVPPERWNVVGPVCESADQLGRDRSLALEAGDLLAIREAGAYGAAMSSNYNSRPRCCELIVDAGQIFEVRRRETWEDLVRGESLLPSGTDRDKAP